MLQDNNTENKVDYARTNGQIDLKVELIEHKNESILDITTNVAMAYITAYLCKRLLVGNSKNPVRKIGGLIVEMLVANEVYKNADTIKMVGSKIAHKIVKKLNR